MTSRIEELIVTPVIVLYLIAQYVLKPENARIPLKKKKSTMVHGQEDHLWSYIH